MTNFSHIHFTGDLIVGMFALFVALKTLFTMKGLEEKQRMLNKQQEWIMKQIKGDTPDTGPFRNNVHLSISEKEHE